jgi:hypothetical protein
MTNPITPPLELVDKWEEEWHHSHFKHGDVDLSPCIATRAAQWGADQELEACVAWLRDRGSSYALALYTARRPKPPSLTEQALRVLVENGTNLDGRMELDSTDIETIRRALEALND